MLVKILCISKKEGRQSLQESSVLSIRAALDRHLKATPFNKKFSIYTALFSKVNKTLSSYLKQLVSQGKIAGTVHKIPLTTEIIKKLYEQGKLADADTLSPQSIAPNCVVLHIHLFW